MVQGVPCPDHGNWVRERRHCSLFVTERGVLRRTFWLESRLIRSSRIQRCRLFSERVGPRLILLESQPGKQRSDSKRSREVTTEPIAVWVQTTKTLTKNRQSMTACGYCCYCLEHFSKIHIAIKRAKYENLFGLVAHQKHAICFLRNMSISKFIKIRLFVTWIKYLTSKLAGSLVGCRKKNNVWCLRQIVREN